jgi:hypothetical protein
MSEGLWQAQYCRQFTRQLVVRRCRPLVPLLALVLILIRQRLGRRLLRLVLGLGAACRRAAGAPTVRSPSPPCRIAHDGGYLNLAYPEGAPDPLPAELEEELPPELQDWSGFEN